MAVERPLNPDATAFNPLNAGYAWWSALNPLSELRSRKMDEWAGVSANLAQEAQRLSEDSQTNLRKFAELQLATAQKAMSAKHPTALAEISSEWTVESLNLASTEASRHGEAFSRIMNMLWAPQAEA
jgi:leucyl aminopeptidase (aminopeptidase T)